MHRSAELREQFPVDGLLFYLFIYLISKMLLNIYGEITSSLEETLETLTLNSDIH